MKKIKLSKLVKVIIKDHLEANKPCMLPSELSDYKKSITKDFKSCEDIHDVMDTLNGHGYDFWDSLEYIFGFVIEND